MTALPSLDVDMVTMTGNVALVFLTDHDWAAVLHAAPDCLGREGHLVFVARRCG